MNITCSALAENLLESELFGHERGAFTDAHKQKKGLLELADGGTVFLDEIGEMGPTLQAKLLRFLEEKAFKRVGGADDIRVDVRIIAATNRDLQRMVREGRFREDLYYRLRVVPLELPALRDRAGDVPQLARLFLRQFTREFGKHVDDIAPEALAALAAYEWPGNVRELRNAVERAVLLAEGPVLDADDFRLPCATVRTAIRCASRRRGWASRSSSAASCCRPWRCRGGTRRRRRGSSACRATGCVTGWRSTAFARPARREPPGLFPRSRE